jgi:hypothetical protein
VTATERSHPPTPVLLPTTRWTEACSEIAVQPCGDDGLSVICDTDDDPVAERRGGESPERFVRFQRLARHHAPLATAFDAALSVALASLCLLAPVAGVPLVTALVGTVYARFGIRRATFLLAGPGVIAAPFLLAYAFASRTFGATGATGGGRRSTSRSRGDAAPIGGARSRRRSPSESPIPSVGSARAEKRQALYGGPSTHERS